MTVLNGFCSGDLLQVPPQFYGPLVNRAESLYDRVGIHSLVTALLKLTFGSIFSPRDLHVSKSILSGRRGFVPLLLFDPKQLVRTLGPPSCFYVVPKLVVRFQLADDGVRRIRSVPEMILCRN